MRNLLCFAGLAKCPGKSEKSEKTEPSNDVQKEPSKDPEAPRRQFGLTNILILDSPKVPLQPTSKSIFTLMAAGLLGLLIGTLVLVIQPYDFIFKWKSTFGPGGEIYEIWRAPPVDLYLKVYLFNVTNHEAYMSRQDSKLKIQEIGPYVYKEYLEHGNVTFNDNGTVTAIPLHPLEFVPELSNGTESDIVVMPNIALLSIANVMRDASILSRMGLNMLIRQTDSKPLVPMTAKEFMFGYQSTLVTLGNNFMPSWIKFERLGLIDRMYDFSGDYETVYTGEVDPRLTGLIEKYNGNENLPQWTGKCANVSGASDGAKFQSYIKPNDTLKFFRKSLCRSERLEHIGEKYIKGLYTYKYKFVDNELDNGHFNPENKCFCRQGYCLPYGLIDVTDCYYGFPIALSYPHFYLADPAVLEPLEGIAVNKDIHESYFYIQPQSGLPVDIAFRFQINLALQDVSAIEHVDGFSNIVIPLVWFEIGMHGLPDNLNTRFFLYLNILPAMQEIAIYGFFLAGVVFLVWSVTKIMTYRPKDIEGAATTNQWLEAEIARKRMAYLNERRPSLKTKETGVYFNALLQPTEEELIDKAALKEIANLKEDIV
ncbi:scavenger receptor class B member 1-like isoform X2 [Phymastichus coffea]|uniref:scavenger receptor class B member 1-like isoform X2 n=1 Tax=Phymastichus coffea TaxID=108790 RepID=UPI00273CE2CC|nr:scavenger receptor class B member 1-like isoform X2 [Phymastichus coffea]